VRNTLGGVISILLIAVACSAAPAATTGGGATSAPASASATTPAKLKITCLVKDISAGVWQQAIKGCEKAAAEFNFELIVTSGTSDTSLEAQVNAFDNALTKGVNGIAMAAIDSDGMVPSVEKANGKGVPVVTFDTTVSGGKLLANVVPADYQGAFDATTLLANTIGGKGKVAITTCSITISTCRTVREGFLAALEKFPNIELVGQPLATPDRDKGFNAIKDILVAHPDLAGVYSTFDLDGLGAFQAGTAANHKLVVVTRGCGYEVLNSIKDGGITGCDALYFQAMGYQAAKAIVDFYAGKTITTPVLIPADIVTKDNAAKWLAIPEFGGPPA
jgi:ribose transport system substrate-binding protein